MAETLYINKERVDSHFMNRPRLRDSDTDNCYKQAMELLRDLEEDGLPDATSASEHDTYVKAQGAAWLFAPGKKEIPAGFEGYSAAISGLLDVRWAQVEMLKKLEKKDTYWLLVLEDRGRLTAAAVVDRQHFGANALTSRANNNSCWAAFGLPEQVVDGIPMITVIYAWYLPAGQNP